MRLFFFWPIGYRIIRTLLNLFQEVFFALHCSAARYSIAFPLSKWVFTVVVNKVRDFMRRTRREKLRLVEPHASVARLPPDPHQECENQDTARWLQEQLRTLPFEEREIVHLCCVKDLPQAEAAEILGLPLGTLKTKLRRLRFKLAAELTRRDNPDSDEVEP